MNTIASLVLAYIEFIADLFQYEVQTFWGFFLTLALTVVALVGLYWQTQHIYQHLTKATHDA